ncbi:MAG: response regulator transcription factor [Nitrospirae bacterium]|nr:response regulator transcription factor [Nitrospirota bacterium]MBI3593719.1 response regulator transcription factor [Nitrospirota bacterium]
MGLDILLADDHGIFREGVKAYLERKGFQIIAEAASGDEAIQMAQKYLPDIAILDLSMPILNGIDAAKEIHRVCPKTKTIILTIHDEDLYVLEAQRARISGYVLKQQAGEDLLQAIDQVSRGSVYLSPGISKIVVEAFLDKKELPSDPLTSRERQVLQLVAEGNSTKEIAQFLGVSPKTAESHRGRIMDKLDIHGTVGLVRYAIRQGLIQP